RPRLRPDQHRHQDDRVQRPAGGEAVGRARQDDQQGRGLPRLRAPGVRHPGAALMRPGAAAGAVLAVVFVLHLLGRAAGETYAVFLLPLEREFGWARSQLTSVYSAYLLVGGFIAPLVGLVFDRLGPRVVYPAGLLALSTAFFLASTLGDLWQFYVFIG